jgi:hypothetical protein
MTVVYRVPRTDGWARWGFLCTQFGRMYWVEECWSATHLTLQQALIVARQYPVVIDAQVLEGDCHDA